MTFFDRILLMSLYFLSQSVIVRFYYLFIIFVRRGSRLVDDYKTGFDANSSTVAQ